MPGKHGHPIIFAFISRKRVMTRDDPFRIIGLINKLDSELF
jgi:hypothetical protein